MCAGVAIPFCGSYVIRPWVVHSTRESGPSKGPGFLWGGGDRHSSHYEPRIGGFVMRDAIKRGCPRIQLEPHGPGPWGAIRHHRRIHPRTHCQAGEKGAVTVRPAAQNITCGLFFRHVKIGSFQALLTPVERRLCSGPALPQ